MQVRQLGSTSKKGISCVGIKHKILYTTLKFDFFSLFGIGKLSFWKLKMIITCEVYSLTFHTIIFFFFHLMTWMIKGHMICEVNIDFWIQNEWKDMVTVGLESKRFGYLARKLVWVSRNQKLLSLLIHWKHINQRI